MKTGELVERLLTILPQLRVLRMSGYSAAEVATPAHAESGMPFLRKPFTLDELSSAVKDVLDTSP